MSRVLTGWGRYPATEVARLAAPRSEEALRRLLAEGPVIARGNGRSYGDSAANPETTVDMRGFRRILDFDAETGQVTCEAGVILGDVIAAFLPQGWFPAVTPGTKLITIGGAIAADVHGKNHRRDGSFGAHVDWIDVMGADGTVTRCSPQSNSDLFRQTLGGMGLTGMILRAAFRLLRVETGWIAQDMRPARDLDEAIEIFEAETGPRYAVAWFDCLGAGEKLGRSLVMLGDHARVDQIPSWRRARPFDVPVRAKRNVPLDAPAAALNRYTLRAFNALYYWNGARKAGPSVVDWDSYFYPLDALGHWNRIYGKPGFAQFQCVLPLEASRAGLEALLARISGAGQGSFLAVLKRLGPQTTGAQSFPMEGYTLALDFAVTEAALALLRELDAIVLDHGGRYYLAKESRLDAATLHRADPRLTALAEARRTSGLDRQFYSGQSRRLKL